MRALSWRSCRLSDRSSRVSFARTSTLAAAVAAVCALPMAMLAQGAAKRAYPVPPKPLPAAEEIALAVSAAPDEISSRSDVYVLRGTAFVKVRTGTNGGACMVGRDLHEGSRYPICFDREAARTELPREMMEGSLRAKGQSEDAVIQAVDAAYASGKLRKPTVPALAYMMSPQQVLFSSPQADGFRVGSWWPHVMITTTPSFSPAQLGLLSKDSKVDVISTDVDGKRHAVLTVKVPKWSDGKAAGKM